MHKSGSTIFRIAPLALLFMALTALRAEAQYNAGIEGTVKDTSGAVVPGVTVTVTNEATARTQEVVTSGEGFYRVSALAPGRYTVSARLTGFKEQTVKAVAVTTEAVVGVDITLQPGDIRETVTVTSEAASGLQTEDANLGDVLDTRQIANLPQVGRDPYELIRLAAGVFGDGARQGNGNSQALPNANNGPGGSNSSIFQTENQVPISSAGQRFSNNNYQLDGVSANSLTWGGAAVVSPNQESVQEIQVVTNGYSAEYGRNSGATIRVVSKNGTNQFHGSGLFKLDDPGLNAYNKYGGANALPTRVNDATRQFAGSLGGPIKKDKLYFFFSYEGLRDNSSNVSTAWVETQQFRQNVIAARPNSVTTKIFQDPGIQPRVVNALTVPCPSGFAAGTCQQVSGGLDIGSLAGGPGVYIDNFSTSKGGGLDGIPDIMFGQFSLPQTSSGNQYNGRVDFTPTSKDTIAVSTYITHFNQTGADISTGSRPQADVSRIPINSVTTVLWNRAFSSSWLNQARANFTRYAFNQVDSNPQVNWGIPRVEIQGFPFGRIQIGAQRAESTPGVFAENTIGFNDMMTRVLGNKIFRFGVEVTKEQDNNNLLGGARPDIVFQGPWDLANDAPIFEAVNVDPRTGLPASAQRYFRTGDYGLFSQYDWKLRPNLTLNFGLRWEYFTPLDEARGEMSNLVPGTNGFANATVQVVNRLYNSDRNNFAPRFGFAYAPAMLSSKLVVRGGYGIFYDRIPEVNFANTRGNPPFLARDGICCGTSGSPYVNGQILYALGSNNSPDSYPVNSKLATGIDPATGGQSGVGVEIYGAFPNTPASYVHEWSFGFEYSLPANMVAAIGYQGSAGHKLLRLVNQNYLYPPEIVPVPGNPGQTYQPFNAVYFPIPDVNSNFNAMNLRLSRPFARGLQAQVYYRYGKSIDESSNSQPGFVTNETYPQSLKAERGPSDFDVTHYFVASAVYTLPLLNGRKDLLGAALGGWEIDPIFTARSGYPWTPVSGQSVETPGGPSLSPTRPVAYLGGALSDTSNDAFIRAGGDFPGGGSRYFNITQSGPPGIGRNSWRGPHYFSTDLSLVKNIRLPGVVRLGEDAAIELRSNFFNLFNNLNLAPFNFGDSSTHIDDNTFFGRATAGLAGRVVEFQARLRF